MTPALRIVSAGLSTTIQDAGRWGYQRLGVSHCGALDPVALAAANILVGNPSNTGAIEALYVGPSFAVDADDARVAFVGADAAIEILREAGDAGGEMIPPLQSTRVRRGQILRVGHLKNGTTLYIAVEGGFDIEPVLGSVATDCRSGMGGWKGRALAAGDALPLRRAHATERDEWRIDGLDLRPPSRFRVLPGPQSEYFPDDEIERLLASEYTVGAQSNRMGLRLGGTPIRSSRGFDIVSDAVAAGSIQIPGNGQPIVLLADHQTTGGYPKIATVISADLPAIGRLPIGSKLSFARVTLEEALAARRALNETLHQLSASVAPLSPTPGAIAARLLECNLISGICNAAA